MTGNTVDLRDTMAINGVGYRVYDTVRHDGGLGNDTATIHNFSSTVTVELWTGGGLYTDSYSNQVELSNTESITVSAGFGAKATFYDSAGDDTFVGWHDKSFRWQDGACGMMIMPEGTHTVTGLGEVVADASNPPKL